MAVIIGSARIDENGRATGGKAGNQTGKEISTQNWYKNSKGWRVFRAKDPEKRTKIAMAMRAACENPQIGYDQNERNTLYNNVKEFGFDPAKTTKAVETDCSALVRVCCAYAGILLPNFYTGDQPKTLLDSGAFDEMVGAKYTDQSTYLMAGDVLVTKTKGHTVVVLTDGPKYGENPPEEESVDILKKGDAGEAVKKLQENLLSLGYSLPKYGADGDIGGETLSAVKAFQKDHGLDADGEVGPLTKAELQKAMNAVKGRNVVVTGDYVNVRTAPNLSANVLGVVEKGDLLTYQGEDSPNGWHLVIFQNKNAWISGKFSEVK